MNLSVCVLPAAVGETNWRKRFNFYLSFPFFSSHSSPIFQIFYQCFFFHSKSPFPLKFPSAYPHMAQTHTPILSVHRPLLSPLHAHHPPILSRPSQHGRLCPIRRSHHPPIQCLARRRKEGCDSTCKAGARSITEAKTSEKWDGDILSVEEAGVDGIAEAALLTTVFICLVHLVHRVVPRPR